MKFTHLIKNLHFFLPLLIRWVYVVKNSLENKKQSILLYSYYKIIDIIFIKLLQHLTLPDCFLYGGGKMSGSLSQMDIEDIYYRHVDPVYRVCFMFMKTNPKLRMQLRIH